MADHVSLVVGLSLAFSSGFTWMLSIMMGVVFISSQLKVHAIRDALDEQEVDDRNCGYDPVVKQTIAKRPF